MKAVLFDLDGVIIDNMHVHASIIKKVLAERGIETKEKDVLEREGEKGSRIIASLMEGRPDDEEVRRAKKEWEEEYVRKALSLSPNPRMIQLIKGLKEEGILVALVTGSSQPLLNKTIGKTQSLFQVIITSDQAKNSKPSPQPYLKAAQELGVPAEECIVVENAVLGVKSAKKAGMTCIALTTTLPEEDLEEADYVVKDSQELEEKINQLTKLINNS